MMTRPPSLLAVGACLWIAAGLGGCSHGGAGAAAGPRAPAPAAPTLEGAWVGTLHLGGGEEYATIDETMSPTVLVLVGDWIERRAR